MEWSQRPWGPGAGVEGESPGVSALSLGTVTPEASEMALGLTHSREGGNKDTGEGKGRKSGTQGQAERRPRGEGAATHVKGK
jgi:hypothetical protein